MQKITSKFQSSFVCNNLPEVDVKKFHVSFETAANTGMEYVKGQGWGGWYEIVRYKIQGKGAKLTENGFEWTNKTRRLCREPYNMMLMFR